METVSVREPPAATVPLAGLTWSQPAGGLNAVAWKFSVAFPVFVTVMFWLAGLAPFATPEKFAPVGFSEIVA